MREAIVSLVLVGGLLVAVPAVFEGVKMSQTSRILLERPEVTNVNLGNTLSDTYCFGCWMTGTLLAGAGIHLTYRSLKARSLPPAGGDIGE